MNNFIIAIPAYNPDIRMVEVVKNLVDKFKFIIVVNDGSKVNSLKYFNEIKDNVILLKNKENKGKGYSLKKAFKYVIEKEIKVDGVITMDSDGQHLVEDVEKIAKKLNENKRNKIESVLLGSRDFREKQVPIRSKIGNKISSYIFKNKKAVYINDTQTGLRGIPIKYLKELIMIKGERFEYEQNVLNFIVDNKILIEEIKIHTIYLKKSHSNFKTLKDSKKIFNTFR